MAKKENQNVEQQANEIDKEIETPTLDQQVNEIDQQIKTLTLEQQVNEIDKEIEALSLKRRELLIELAKQAEDKIEIPLVQLNLISRIGVDAAKKQLGDKWVSNEKTSTAK